MAERAALSGAREAAVRVAAMVALLLPSAAGGQILRGRVVADTLPVAEAEVVVTDSAGADQRTVTDADGLFVFELSARGLYTVRAVHGGFGPVPPQPVEVEAWEEVVVEIRLATAIPLPAIEVTARRLYGHGALLETVEERLAWAEKAGLGRVMRREEIERRNAGSIHDLLLTFPRVEVTSTGTTRGVRFTGAAGGCMPQVYIDGVRDVTRQGMLDAVVPTDLEIVEVYRGALEAPPEYWDPQACGVVLLWTRRELTGGRPWTWKRLLALGGILAFMLISFR